MDNRFLCVMAGFDPTTESRLAAMRQKLYDLGFVGEQTKGIPQHITLGTFPIEGELEVQNLLNTVARKVQAFPVTFNSIGIFQGSRVLFVAPDPSRDLLNLKGSFGMGSSWTPHVTLLMDEPATIYRAASIIGPDLRAFEGKIEWIYLYEFWPTRLICSERLGYTPELNL